MTNTDDTCCLIAQPATDPGVQLPYCRQAACPNRETDRLGGAAGVVSTDIGPERSKRRAWTYAAMLTSKRQGTWTMPAHSRGVHGITRIAQCGARMQV